MGRGELDAVAAPAGALGSHQAGAAPEEAVEHDLSPGGAVEDRIGHQGDRLHGRMKRQQVPLLGFAREGVDPGVAPDVAAVSAKAAKLDIVAMRSASSLEDEDKLMLAAVQRAHAGIVLDPDTEILELGINLPAGGEQ